MIEFRKIENSFDPLFPTIYKLYKSAFPAIERRNLGALEAILNYEKRFEMDVLIKGEKSVGFFAYWTFERFVYVEHFAIDPNMRGHNIEIGRAHV